MKGQGVHRPAVQTSCLGRGLCWQELLRAGPAVSPFQQVQLHLSDVVKIGRVRKLCRSVTHNTHIPGTPWIMQNKPVLFDLLLVCASMRGENWCVCVHARHLFQENVSGQGVGMVQVFALSREHTFYFTHLRGCLSQHMPQENCFWHISCLEWRRENSSSRSGCCCFSTVLNQ